MMINKTNYEEYLVDYAEGTLTDSEAREVEAFLAENPDAAAELEAFTTVKLQPGPVKFFDKKSLYRKEAAEPRVIKLGTVLKYSSAVAAAAVLIIVLLIWHRSSREAAPVPGIAQEQPKEQPVNGRDDAQEKSSQTIGVAQQQTAVPVEKEVGKDAVKRSSMQAKSHLPVPAVRTAATEKNFTKQVEPIKALPVPVAFIKPLPNEKPELTAAIVAAKSQAEPVPAPVDGEQRGLLVTLLSGISGTFHLGKESTLTIDQKTQQQKTYYTLTVDTPVLYVSQSFKSK